MSDLHASYQAYLELQNQIKALQEKATLLMMEGRAKAIEDIRQLVKVYEIKADELGYPVPAPAPRRERKPDKRRDRSPKGEPKYRDPDTQQTWTGAGKPPNWIKDKNYDDFLINPPAPAAPPAQQSAPTPTPTPALAAQDAVQHMVSAHMPAPSAAWPDPATMR
jgi:DNA-binding protein H-NS